MRKTPNRATADLYRRIAALSLDSTLREVRDVIGLVFKRHFGDTPLDKRLKDIEGEILEFIRAVQPEERSDEHGDVLASLLMYGIETNDDPALRIQHTLRKICKRALVYAKRGSKKQIAILRRAFDPPSREDLAMAEALLKSDIGIDEVWLMPIYKQSGSEMHASAKHRAAMCRLLENIDPRIKFFGFEIDQRFDDDMLRTVRLLQKERFANKFRFYYGISLKTANDMPHWDEYAALTQQAIFITLPRHASELNPRQLWFTRQPHHFLADAPTLDACEQSRIQHLYSIKRYRQASALVPKAIHDYIRQHGLYLKKAM